MTLETTKTYRGKTRKFETTFDPDLLKEITFHCKPENNPENMFMITYKAEDIPELCAPNIDFFSYPESYIKITGNNIYWLTCYYIPKEIQDKHPLKNYICHFMDEWEFPEVEFMVKLTEEEVKQFLLTVLKKAVKGEVKHEII